jgi:D-alanyl-D-alanine carboxypeptidase (penicillin-binding protein 5/6)
MVSFRVCTVYTRRRFLTAAGSLLVAGRSWAQAPAEKPLPDKLPADRIDGPPLVSARAWAIAEGSSGRLLWGNNEAAALNMASTSKIMTASLVLGLVADHPKLLDETLVVSESAAKTGGSSAQIRTGERYILRDLLHGLMLPSGNDAAVALAEHCGPRFRPANGKALAPAEAFVAQMNRHAQSLRMAETRYFDPHGLGRNVTSARDLLKLAHSAMQNETFRQLVQTRRHRCEAIDAKGEKRSVTWTNTNKLLDIEGYDGIKTGTTTAAGFCLCSSGRRGDDHLYVVVLGSTSNDNRYMDSRNLYRWAWQQRGHKPG